MAIGKNSIDENFLALPCSSEYSTGTPKIPSSAPTPTPSVDGGIASSLLPPASSSAPSPRESNATSPQTSASEALASSQSQPTMASNGFPMTSQAAAPDIGPPAFEPGKPWKGFKNVEEDPHATPGSISSNLDISRCDFIEVCYDKMPLEAINVSATLCTYDSWNNIPCY